MNLEQLNFTSRLWLALALPWKVLFSAELASRVARAGKTPLLTSEPEARLQQPKSEPPEVAAVAIEAEADQTAALQLLALLQREGRLIDFLQEEMSDFGDAEIGAAARVVHEGCRRSLAEVVSVTAIRDEAEGAAVQLEAGYNARETRVTGNVGGEPPFRGTLAHHGWRAESVRLPKLSSGHDARILAPAEVEL